MSRTLSTVTDVLSLPAWKHGNTVCFEIFIICRWISSPMSWTISSLKSSVLEIVSVLEDIQMQGRVILG